MVKPLHRGKKPRDNVLLVQFGEAAYHLNPILVAEHSHLQCRHNVVKSPSIGDNMIRFSNARLDLGSSQPNELAPCLPVPVSNFFPEGPIDTETYHRRFLAWYEPGLSKGIHNRSGN
jgi:hypothetical protein